MNRDFYIDKLSDENINQISIALNELEEVTRLKIVDNTIRFVCHDTTQIEAIVKEIDESIILHEVINDKKTVFEEEIIKKELIFLFINLNSEEDAIAIEGVLSKYSAYENVSVDFKNKLLTLTTDDLNVEKRLNRIVDKINMDIDVTLWKKPYRSNDIFNQVFMQKYFRYTVLLVAMALAVVTTKDQNIFTAISWLIVTGLASDCFLVGAFKDLRIKRFISVNVTFIISLLLGWVYGAYFETFIVAVVYRFSEFILTKVTGDFVSKIDRSISIPEMGRKKKTSTKFEMVPLREFLIGDVLVVYPGETVLLGGKVVKGDSVVDTYALDGKEVLSDISTRTEVQSGTVNLGSEMHVKVAYTFEDSAFNKIMKIAANAPSYETRTQRLVEKLIKYSTVLFVIIAVLTSIILPIIDYRSYSWCLYIGATMLTIASGHSIRESASFGVLAGVARAFQDGILIKENSCLDTLHASQTIIYDRFDGVEISDDELDLFKKFKSLHQDVVIFNDGPTDLENDQYRIFNNLSLEEKIIIMQKASLVGPVAYIGDSSKDVKLLQKSHVAISRGGLHNDELTDNSDIIVTDVNHEVIYKLFKLSQKQSYIGVQNILLTIFSISILIILSLSGILSWVMAQLIYFIVTYFIIGNTYRIFNEAKVNK